MRRFVDPASGNSSAEKSLTAAQIDLPGELTKKVEERQREGQGAPCSLDSGR